MSLHCSPEVELHEGLRVPGLGERPLLPQPGLLEAEADDLQLPGESVDIFRYEDTRYV